MNLWQELNVQIPDVSSWLQGSASKQVLKLGYSGDLQTTITTHEVLGCPATITWREMAKRQLGRVRKSDMDLERSLNKQKLG